ncbi:MAG: cellulase family glycosylhydrolase [Kofleriaceae bacterium]
MLTKLILGSLFLAACGASMSDPLADDGPDPTGSGSNAGSDGSGSGSGSDSGSGSGSAALGGLHTGDGKILDGAGNVVFLHGADRAGTEYMCLGGGGTFDGPHDQASIDAMKSWHINAVRVPMNEDCWLGINGVGDATYKDDIRSWVTLLEQNDMYVILDLHWAAPGSQQANGQLGMADLDHSPQFWSEVAAAYAGEHDRVIFDLFNEPFITDWECWGNGGTCAQDNNGSAYQVAGMQQLVDAVRGANADNLVLMGGISYAAEFDGWLHHVPNDPNVAVSWHAYSFQSVDTDCPSQYNGYAGSCDDGTTTASHYGIPQLLAAHYPIVVGEIGISVESSDISPYTQAQAGYLTTWLDGLLTYLDLHGIGYLAWDWSTEAPPRLISAYDGTPSPYFGETYKAHLNP